MTGFLPKAHKMYLPNASSSHNLPHPAQHYNIPHTACPHIAFDKSLNMPEAAQEHVETALLNEDFAQ